MLRVRAAVALLLGGWSLPLVAEHEATWQADGLGLPTLAPLPPALDRLKFRAVDLAPRLSQRRAGAQRHALETLGLVHRRRRRIPSPPCRALGPASDAVPALPQPHTPEAGGRVVRLEQRGYNDDTAGPYQLKGAAVLGYRVTAAW